MPRSRESDVPQRPSPRVPVHMKTTACSEANSVHRPVAADRSPKVSPRGVLHERKKGTRLADLETKLSRAQEELKKLKHQLASAEAAKLEAEQALAKAKNRIPAAASTPKDEEVKPLLPQDSGGQGNRQRENKPEEESVTSPATMDVFEVMLPTEAIHGENEGAGNEKKVENAVEREEVETKTMIEKTSDGENNEAVAAEEEDDKRKPVVVLPESVEVDDLKAKLLEKEKEVEILLEENVIFKTNAEEEAKQIAGTARAKEAELTAKLGSVEGELKESRAKADELAEQLEAAEGAKAALETEMKRLRVQTEQWRKAAEAAAAVLATDDGAEGRRVAERCGSMDKHIGWESPLIAGGIDEDNAAGGGGRRKGAGIRALGDIWRKKALQK
ncbi:Interactor of constitutive active ROPs [Musa troglodytarum]|nr:Interactor of constitutive active ROPs [Musa troglodytarum]URE05648.1 Interactor of constitutive active ROPs [Musa troglodytarum]URE05651.1 Interactor of constitutive active ROPs [Musa troglodytarum]URE05652.1 Interactor of constitutive active ROPs [Musa troglodytarum]